MFGRKYWPETPLSEYSPKKRLDEYSARFPFPGSFHASRSLFSRKDAIEISIYCLETSAPEAIRGEGNSSCPSLEPKIRSLGPICPNIHPIYQKPLFLFRWSLKRLCRAPRRGYASDSALLDSTLVLKYFFVVLHMSCSFLSGENAGKKCRDPY